MRESTRQPCEGLEVTVPTVSDATFKYTWRIKKYGKLCTRNESFDSTPFECNANGDRTRWNLSIRYWKGKEGKRLESPIVMCLNLLDSSVKFPGQATVSFEFGVFNTKSSQWETCPKSRTVLYLPSSADILSVGYRDLRLNKPHLESNTGTLAIYVKIQLSFTDEAPGTRLQQDMGKLLSEGAGDITVKCAQGRTIRAHSSILAARSQILKDMLRGGSVLDVDLTEDAARQMLQYIYTDSADLAGNATVLVSIAHRFQLNGLKESCESYLADNISANNVPSLLLVAEQFECETLKRALMSYCEGNANVIQKNMTWKVLEMVNPELFEEVCEAGLGSSISSNMDSLPSDPETP